MLLPFEIEPPIACEVESDHEVVNGRGTTSSIPVSTQRYTRISNQAFPAACSGRSA